jgi:hypothetical protein
MAGISCPLFHLTIKIQKTNHALIYGVNVISAAGYHKMGSRSAPHVHRVDEREVQ